MTSKAPPFSKRYVKHRVKPARTLRRFWQGLQKPVETGLGSRNIVLAITVLAVLIGGTAIFNSAFINYAKSGNPFVDPWQTVWTEKLASGDLSAWNSRLASYAS